MVGEYDPFSLMSVAVYQVAADEEYCDIYSGVHGGQKATALAMHPFLSEVAFTDTPGLSLSHFGSRTYLFISFCKFPA